MNRISAAVLIAFVLLLSFSSADAQKRDEVTVDDRAYKFVQGFVTAESPARLVLNERWTVNLSPDTRVYNTNGRETDPVRLRGHKWIYVEGPLNEYGNIEAQKVYLLPGYVDKAERWRYPFINTP